MNKISQNKKVKYDNSGMKNINRRHHDLNAGNTALRIALSHENGSQVGSVRCDDDEHKKAVPYLR